MVRAWKIVFTQFSWIIFGTGDPQACILSPLLYYLYTSDCVGISSSNVLVNFAYNTVVGLISNNNKMHEVEKKPGCMVSGHSMNVKKTKELILHFGQMQIRNYSPSSLARHMWMGKERQILQCAAHYGLYLLPGKTWRIQQNIRQSGL